MENKDAWRGFLSRLVGRGTNPSELGLVVFDEHNGLLSAALEVFGDVPYQLCWAHRCRNVRKSVCASDRKLVIAGLQEVYQATSLHAAKEALRRWCARWRAKYPNVVASDDTDTLNITTYPVSRRA